jgi:hypothetical protein
MSRECRPKYTYSVTSRDFVGDGSSCGDPAQGCEASHPDLQPEATAVSTYAIGGLLSTVTGESTSPGEDPTGASAEREGGFDFDLQPKGRRARGGYKGAREVLA